jgi:hypothetical protein
MQYKSSIVQQSTLYLSQIDYILEDSTVCSTDTL